MRKYIDKHLYLNTKDHFSFVSCLYYLITNLSFSVRTVPTVYKKLNYTEKVPRLFSLSLLLL